MGHYLDLGEQNRSFSDLAAYFTSFQPGDAKVSGHEGTERLNSLQVTQNFLPFLGVQPSVRRNFTAEECRWNAPGAVLLSYALWKRRYGADPGIIGRPVTLNDSVATIVGVAPESFDFGSVFAPGIRQRSPAWLVICRHCESQRSNPWPCSAPIEKQTTIHDSAFDACVAEGEPLGCPEFALWSI